MVSRHFALALAAVFVIGLATGLLWWAIASGAKPCQPGYKLRYQYTEIIGKTQIVHYQCVRSR